MSDNPAWLLTFKLTEYTPAEVEAMSGLSVAMQRDWRHRGFGPQFEKHARFDIVQVAELLFMKVCSDQGKGPALSHVHARAVALTLIKNALTYASGSWISDPVSVFDSIPQGSRSLTDNEQAHFFDLHDPMMERWRTPERIAYLNQLIDEGETEQYVKKPWLVDRLFDAIGCTQSVSLASNVIWWPNGQLQLGDYKEIIISKDAEPDENGYLDPKFDGPAFVWSIDHVAERLTHQAPRPFVSVGVEVDKAFEARRISSSDKNLGKVIVLRGKNAEEAENEL